VQSWDWEYEVECLVTAGEPRTHDYPGSGPEVEFLTVQMRPEGDEEWGLLDNTDILAEWDDVAERVRAEAIERAAELWPGSEDEL
jgi:hypothetical protein